MKKIQLVAIGVFVIAIIAVPYRAFAFLGVEVGVGYWQQSPSGTISYQGTSDLDLKNDLFLSEKGQAFYRVKAELPLILPNIYFLATPMSFEGSGTLTRQITYGNTTFNVTTPIQTNVKLNQYDLALFYPIPLLKTATVGVLNVELGLNARKIDFEGTISQDSLSASKSLSIYLPMVYAGVQVKPISLFAIEGEFRGIAIGENHYYDYIAKLKVNPVPIFYISGGYRSQDIKINQSDVMADVRFSGPFVEAGFSF
ncbi:MAG TPA: TIGR04219 family outer membrane beta-barrel protein [Nitrospirota bacterium]|nr:TIGR04219 family outer membrane beta-barrel protein [Nitrospirota bacterium]